MTADKPILVWRDSLAEGPEWDGAHIKTPTHCRWCRVRLASRRLDNGTYGGMDYLNHEQVCPLCGWPYDISWCGEGYGHAGRLATFSESCFTRIIRTFPLTSPELRGVELCAHVRREFDDRFGITPRQFESMVHDLFRSEGYTAELTQQTRDGGADVILYSEDHSQRLGIIECKRLGSGRIASVKEVRALVGAALDFRVRSATLVTTTDFSKEAIAYAGRMSDQGLNVDLVAGVELLRRLESFPQDLPTAESLASLSSDVIDYSEYFDLLTGRVRWP